MKKTIRMNALLNTVKQLMQILFPVITIRYVARVLQPENYGRINTGNAIISYITLIAGLGISTYAVREGSLVREDKKELTRFSSQVFSINLLSTALAYIVLAALVFLVPHYYGYCALLAIQGVSVLFAALGADWINSIEEDYLYITIRYIVLHIISLALMFLLVKKPEDYYIYAAICLITSAGGNLLNIFYIRRYVKLRFTFQIDWKKHLVPILVLFGNAVAMTIYVSSDITMLELFKGAAEVGIYSVATKIYTVVKQVLNAVLVVSIPRLTMFIGSGETQKFCDLGRKIINVLFTLMSPLIVGIIVFRSEAVHFVGGEEYMSGTGSLLILTLAVAASLLATFYSACVMMPMRKEKYILKGTIISAVINVGLNLLFIPLWGSNGAAVTTLISEIFVAVYFWSVVRKEQYRFFRIRELCLSLAGGALVAVICILMKRISDSFIIYFGLSVVASVVTYAAVQYFGKNPLARELLQRKRKASGEK